jgi:hypothetical protein
MIIALLLWERKKNYLSGLLIGFCLVIKPFLMLIGLYFLVRREWNIALGAATVGLGMAALSVLFFGLQMNLDWYEHCIAAFGGRPMGAYNVQSIGGFLMRLQTGRNFLWDWSPRDLIPWLKFAHSAILLGMISTTFGIILWKKPRKSLAVRKGLGHYDYWSFSLVLTLSLVCSTVSWTHYYLLLLLPWALYLGGKFPVIEDKTARYLILMSIIICSIPLIGPHLGFGWWPRQIARTLVSVHLFGGLCFLAALSYTVVTAKRSTVAGRH